MVKGQYQKSAPTFTEKNMKRYKSPYTNLRTKLNKKLFRKLNQFDFSYNLTKAEACYLVAVFFNADVHNKFLVRDFINERHNLKKEMHNV